MTESRRSTARVRLLFDEHLSPKVPQALQIIGFNASHIGGDESNIPPRGTSDQSIVDFAKKTSHVLVTSDHGMMRICADQGLQFVWLDPRGRQYTLREQVLLIFSQIEQWEDLLGSNSKPVFAR